MFSLDLLISEFKKICPDYDEVVTRGSKLKSISFMGSVIYKIGPQSRSKRSRDQTWKFNFGNNKTVFIGTYKNYKPAEEQPKVVGNSSSMSLMLTVKQANILAVNKLMEAIQLLNDDELIMTPLCGAVYEKKAIPIIVKLLNYIVYKNITWTTQKVCKLLIASAETAGHLIHESDGNAAMAIKYLLTLKLADKKLKTSLVSKVVKQYRAQGWSPDINIIKIFLKTSDIFIVDLTDIEAMINNPAQKQLMIDVQTEHSGLISGGVQSPDSDADKSPKSYRNGPVSDADNPCTSRAESQD